MFPYAVCQLSLYFTYSGFQYIDRLWLLCVPLWKWGQTHKKAHIIGPSNPASLSLKAIIVHYGYKLIWQANSWNCSPGSWTLNARESSQTHCRHGSHLNPIPVSANSHCFYSVLDLPHYWVIPFVKLFPVINL